MKKKCRMGIMTAAVLGAFVFGGSMAAEAQVTQTDEAVAVQEKTGWQKEGNNWYYYDEGGEKHTGVLYDQGKYYYFNEAGVMQKGWLEIDDHPDMGVHQKWAYADPDGALHEGWLTQGDKTYYFYAHGDNTVPHMAVGLQWFEEHGTTYFYFFDEETGAMKKNAWAEGYVWGDEYTSWFYAEASGRLHTGWLKSGGKWYHFGGERWAPTMDLGESEVDGKTYYFDYDTGAMKTGWINVEKSYKPGIWEYADKSGVLASGWKKINGKYYYFDPVFRYEDEDGTFRNDYGILATEEWVDGYWLNKDGSWTYKAKGSWKKDKNGWWYGDTSGWYAKNAAYRIDGVWYMFDKKGYLLDSETPDSEKCASSQEQALFRLEGKDYSEAYVQTYDPQKEYYAVVETDGVYFTLFGNGDGSSYTIYKPVLVCSSDIEGADPVKAYGGEDLYIYTWLFNVQKSSTIYLYSWSKENGKNLEMTLNYDELQAKTFYLN